MFSRRDFLELIGSLPFLGSPEKHKAAENLRSCDLVELLPEGLRKASARFTDSKPFGVVLRDVVQGQSPLLLSSGITSLHFDYLPFKETKGKTVWLSREDGRVSIRPPMGSQKSVWKVGNLMEDAEDGPFLKVKLKFQLLQIVGKNTRRA